ncbi:MAG: DUF721 domain-containing protein [Candidatus Electryonea clarkiae]|nr:DUF721 domain-containing protein [Candidatus Electryonea clarkiae]MDP8288971.1 DUF721 domain-containing protein [Candidatus Electryonea clarkiae]
MNGLNAWESWEKETKEKRKRNKISGVSKYSFSRRKNVINVSTAISKWKDSIGSKSRLAEAEIGIRWREIVGANIADHSSPLRLEHGRLILRVKESTWRHHLLFLRAEIIEKINKSVKTDIVKEIMLTG